MNLNIPDNEYKLNESITDELIKIYGTKVKLIFTEKINPDSTFGDFSHIRVDNSNVFELYMFAENTDEFEQGEILSSNFGILPEANINLFTSKPQFETIGKNIRDYLGALIILPSLKVLEITDIQVETPGLNNLFLYNNIKNSYKFKCRSYIQKLSHELTPEILEPEISDSTPEDIKNEVKTLENYFNELVSIKENQDLETDEYTKPDNIKDPIFGRF